ncbi:cytochrome P450 [Sulfuriroseicoccus oceanibius]|uniref:Cytochrome P450 n=1 Tax=Sulfuriroseicoccus oceanibius TaxID=2707525 RepID=A0A6B3LCN6_9BACT|nr:cytochrome P450 [Sulfuriroseicoccus oceanibius]
MKEFIADPLGLLERAVREYGDVVRFRLGPMVEHLVNHPDHVAHVLQSHQANYDKDTRSSSHLRRICGDSLLTTNGAEWRRRRDLIRPAFRKGCVQEFTTLMVDSCGTLLDGWEREAERQRDAASEMTRLTYTIVARALFSTDVRVGASEMEPVMRSLMDISFERLRRVVNLPSWVPTAENRRFRTALAEMDRMVYELIDSHRQSDRYDDLLSMLLRVADDASGQRMTLRDVRNETITLLIAGHETTANALSWTLHLLATHPEIQEDVRDEVASVLGGRPPVVDDLARLELLTRVVHESMRLFPPIWIIERRAIADDEIAGFHIPRGSGVVVSPWTMHGHPGFWEQPDVFDPSRFESGHNPAFMPFGGGQRFCVGNEFAMIEAKVILAMVLQRFRVRPVDGAVIRPFAGITLPPAHGMPLRFDPL